MGRKCYLHISRDLGRSPCPSVNCGALAYCSLRIAATMWQTSGSIHHFHVKQRSIQLRTMWEIYMLARCGYKGALYSTRGEGEGGGMKKQSKVQGLWWALPPTSMCKCQAGPMSGWGGATAFCPGPCLTGGLTLA